MSISAPYSTKEFMGRKRVSRRKKQKNNPQKITSSKKPSTRPAGDRARAKRDMIRIALTAKRLTRALAFILFFLFGWLKLRGVPIGPALGKLSADLLVRASLIVYYASWVFGVLNDTNQQEILYAAPPEPGQFSWKWYAVGAALAAVFGVLCYVDTSQEFAAALAVFLFLNIASWQYLVRRILPSAYRTSRKVYQRESDDLSLFHLDVLWRYLTGSWQWLRFLYGAVLVVLLNLLAFTSLAVNMAAALAPLAEESLVGYVFFIYVLSFEAWMWFRRLKVRMAQQAVSEFSSSYRIVRVGK